MIIKFDSELTKYTNFKDTLQVRGNTVNEVLSKLFNEYPQLYVFLIKANGEEATKTSFKLNGNYLLETSCLWASVSPEDVLEFGRDIPSGENGFGKILMGAALIGIGLAMPAAWSVAATYMMGAGVSFALGGVAELVIGSPQLPTFDSGNNTSATYTFSGVKNTTVLGTPIGICYGTYRVGGHVLSAYNDVIGTDGTGNTSWLRLQIGLCEGEIESIDPTSIEINNRRVNTFPSSDIEAATRYGTKMQTPPDHKLIAATDATSTLYPTGADIRNAGWEHTIEIPSTSIELTFSRVELGFHAQLRYSKVIVYYKVATSAEDYSTSVEFSVDTEWAKGPVSRLIDFPEKAIYKIKVVALATAYAVDYPFSLDKYELKDTGVNNFDINAFMEYFSQIENSIECSLPIVTDPSGTPSETSPGTVVSTTIAVDNLKVNITAPTLYRSDNGGLVETSVDFRLYWKKTSEALYSSTDYVDKSISGKTKSAVDYSVSLPINGYDFYDIKAIRITPSNSEDLSVQDNIYLKELVEILQEKLIYPHTALLGVSIKATEYISGGLPIVTSVVKGTKVLIPENYNPTRRYMSGSFTGNFQADKQWTDNPVWCLYDLITNERYGLKNYFKISSAKLGLMQANFYLMAAYCDDRLLEDGTLIGDTNDPQYELARPRFSLNIVIDQSKSAMEWLSIICATMRASLYYTEGAVFIDIDRPKPITQLFNMSNIKEFTELGASFRQLPNVYEVQFSNKAKDYDQDTLLLEAPEYQQDLTIEESKKALSLTGVTDEGQAKSLAKYSLRVGQLLTTTVTFKTSTYGLLSSVGDVVGVQHDVPQWGYGGTVKSYNSSSNTITLGDTAEILEGSDYSIQISSNSGDTQSVQLGGGLYSEDANVNLIPQSTAEATSKTLMVADAGSTITVDTANRWQGTSSFKTVQTGSTIAGGLYTTPINIDSSAVYSASMWVKGSGVLAVTLKTYPSSTQKTTSIVLTGVWQRVVANNLTSGASDTTARLIARYTTQYAGTFWIDGLQMEAGAESTTFAYGGQSGTYNQFRLLSTPSPLPQVGDYYVVGETSNTVKPFKIVSLKRDKDEVVEVTCVEYNADIYADADDLTDLPTIGMPEYSQLSVATEVSVSNVVAEEYLYISSSGTISNGVRVHYTPPTNSYFWKGASVCYRMAGLSSGFVTTPINNTGQIEVQPANLYEGASYQITVISYYANGTKQSPFDTVNDSSITKTVTILGKQAPPSGVANFSATAVRGTVMLSWDPITDLDLSGYDIQIGTSWDSVGNISLVKNYKGSSYAWVPTTTGTINFLIKAMDTSKHFSSVATETSCLIYMPEQVAELSATESLYYTTASDIKTKLTVTWTGNTLDYGYDISAWGPLDASWVPKGRVTDPSFVLLDVKPGVWKVQVRAVNYFGALGPYLETQKIVVGKEAPPSSVSNLRASVTRDQMLISWDANTEIDVVGYDLQIGAVWDDPTNIKLVSRYAGTSYGWTPSVSGDIHILCKAVDSTYHYSTDAAVYIHTVTSPSAIGSLTASVIDNIVQLSWPPADKGTFSIIYYELWKGEFFESATLVGIKYGTFDISTEMYAGDYKYWVRAVDTTGAVAPEVGLSVAVDQPPDYVVRDTQDLPLNSCTLTNAMVENGAILLPVNTTITWDNHFQANPDTSLEPWETIQDQVDDGYTLFGNPYPSSGSFEHVMDHGSFPSTRIAMSLTKQVLSGAPTITPEILVSSTSATGPWTSLGNFSSVYAPAFRWVKYKWTVTGGFVKVTKVSIKLDVKQKTFTVLANVTDVTRTDSTAGDEIVFSNIGITPIDIIGITADAAFTGNPAKDPIKALINFQQSGVMNPTSFRLLAWDRAGDRTAVNNVVVTIRYI